MGKEGISNFHIFSLIFLPASIKVEGGRVLPIIVSFYIYVNFGKCLLLEKMRGQPPTGSS